MDLLFLGILGAGVLLYSLTKLFFNYLTPDYSSIERQNEDLIERLENIRLDAIAIDMSRATFKVDELATNKKLDVLAVKELFDRGHTVDTMAISLQISGWELDRIKTAYTSLKEDLEETQDA